MQKPKGRHEWCAARRFSDLQKMGEDERFGDLFREFVFERVERNLRRRSG